MRNGISYRARLDFVRNRPIRAAPVETDQNTYLSVITGAPPILILEKVVGRDSNPPHEKDIKFTEEKLDKWATVLFVGI